MDTSQRQTLRNIQGTLEIEDAWGHLWFTNESGEVHHYDATLNSIPYSANSGLGIDRVRTIFEAINGDLWFGHDNGATVFNPSPAIQNHGTGTGSSVRGKSRFPFWTDIVKIFEVDEHIWFINKPIVTGHHTLHVLPLWRRGLR